MAFGQLFGFHKFMGYFNRTGPSEGGQNFTRVEPPQEMAPHFLKSRSILQTAVFKVVENAKEVFKTYKKYTATEDSSPSPSVTNSSPQPITLAIAPVKDVYFQEPSGLFLIEEQISSKGFSVSVEVPNETPDTAADESDTDDSDSEGSEADSSEAESLDEEGEDNDKRWSLRADWTTVEAIPNVHFKEILARHLSKSRCLSDLQLDDIECIKTSNGSYHHVRIFEVTTVEHVEKYVVKVPAAGTAEYWCNIDAQTLRSEAQTMMYIRKHTKVPIPDIIGYDTTFENELGAPFTIMTAVEGRPAYEIFYENVTNSSGELRWMQPNEPDAERMQKRRTMLTTLAQAMAQLAALKFDHTGMLTFADEDTNLERPIFIPGWQPRGPHSRVNELKPEQLREEIAFVQYPVTDSVDEYFDQGLEKVFTRKEDSSIFFKGQHKIMSAMLAFPPFHHDEEEDGEDESFVLHHTDLDFHNIFCNDDGEVVAIIDWSGCRIVPRCLGFASLPHPLRTDWNYIVRGFEFSVATAIHPPWVLDEYRKIYADAMLAATGPHGDGKYTLKSALYHAIDTALHDEDKNPWGCVILLKHILLQIPGTRLVEPFSMFESLVDESEGNSSSYKYLVGEIGKLVKP